ncbi:hypothetical protein ABGF26_03690 [Helcococcus ovis]
MIVIYNIDLLTKMINIVAGDYMMIKFMVEQEIRNVIISNLMELILL